MHINGENFLDILEALDISVGGIGISVPHMFDGCKIENDVSLVITIPFPVMKSIAVAGKVKHIKGKDFGVTFVSIKGIDKKLVEEYVVYRHPK